MGQWKPVKKDNDSCKAVPGMLVAKEPHGVLYYVKEFCYKDLFGNVAVVVPADTTSAQEQLYYPMSNWFSLWEYEP